MSQQSKTTLQSAINTQIADNTSGDISAADIRDNLINITDSLLFNTGSGQSLTGSLNVTEGITGSLLGTASLATTASYVLNAISSSFTTLAQTANTASYIVTAQTASFVATSSWAVSASQAVSASRATTSSFAISASWAPSVASNPFPFTGSAIISGSLAVSGGLLLPTVPDNNPVVSPTYGYMNMFSRGGIHIYDPSTYNNKIIITNVFNMQTQLGCESLLMTNQEGNFVNLWIASAISGLTENTLYSGGPANLQIQSETQLILSGSSSKLTLSGSAVTVTGSVNINQVLTLAALNPLPSSTNGSIAYSSSGDFYFRSGSAWRKLTL